MTCSFLSLKSKLGFVSLAVFASLLASSVVEAKETEAPILTENISAAKGVLLPDVHVYYAVPADLMGKQLDVENLKGYGKRSDEKNSATPEISLKMSRKEFKENRRLAAETSKRMKTSGDCGNKDDERLFKS